MHFLFATERIMKPLLVVLCSLLVLCHAKTRQSGRTFPSDFIFGTATASYQIEGAWDADGKGENIWDRLTHSSPSWIKDESSGDIAADSYHNYKRDVEMMRELGLDAYRLSLSWSRILPTGFTNHINQAGVDYYNNLFDEMLKYNIQPMVTLYHWDLPQPLQDLGGFANSHVTDWFEDYARVAYESFGDKVKMWITFNEPREVCYQGYGATNLAPVINATGIGDYLCAKNLVISHAKAYYLYVNEYKATQGGQVGITTSVSSYEPLTDSEEDALVTEMNRQGQWALYTDPIFSQDGGFPKEFAARVAEKSAAQGYPRSRLPEFTDEEREFVRGSADFFGVNHYSTSLYSATENVESHPVPSLFDDMGGGSTQPDEWTQAASTWLKLAPNSLYNAIMNLHERYGDIDFYVTENGWSVKGGLEDDDRIAYYRAALENALDLLDDGVELKGYMAWSLMDNFEWMQGYTERFGLYEVDFESPARTRTPRKSAFVYKQILKTRSIDHDYDPGTDRVMTIDEGH